MSRHGDWSPLSDGDPTPGNADEVAGLARRYRDTANEISRQADHMRRLASRSSGAWDAEAGRSFSAAAEKLSGKLGQVHDRYAQAARSLQEWSEALPGFQRRADDAAARARDAEARLAATAPDPTPVDPSTPPTPAQQAEQQQRARQHQTAGSDRDDAQRDFQRAVDDYHQRGQDLASALHHVIDHDSVHDSWWDRNVTAHLDAIKTVLKVIGYVVTALAVIALVVSLVVPGLNILSATAIAGIVGALETTAAVGTGVLLVAHSALAVTGQGSLFDVGMDILGLATFGLGRSLGTAAKLAARGARGVAAEEYAARATAQTLRADRLVTRFWRGMDRLPGLRNVLDAPGHLATLAARATRAGTDARRAIETLEVTTTLAGRLRAGGLEMAEQVAQVRRFNELVPGVAALSQAERQVLLTAARSRALGYGGFLLDGLGHLAEDVPPHLKDPVDRWTTHTFVHVFDPSK